MDAKHVLLINDNTISFGSSILQMRTDEHELNCLVQKIKNKKKGIDSNGLQ
jgi:hypothetical protein